MPTQFTRFAFVSAALLGANLILPSHAIAQDTDPMLDPPIDAYAPMTTQDTIPSAFEAADINGDKALDVEEFKSLIVTKAGQGDADARALVIDGDYKTAFAEHDTDSDGLLSEAELEAGSHSGMMPSDSAVED